MAAPSLSRQAVGRLICLSRFWTAEIRSQQLSNSNPICPLIVQPPIISHSTSSQLHFRLDDEMFSKAHGKTHAEVFSAPDQLLRSMITEIRARASPVHSWTAELLVDSRLRFCENSKTAEPAGLGLVLSALRSGHSLPSVVAESAGVSSLEYECGRGDKRSKKGKRFKHSHGKLRPSRGELARRLRVKWEISGPPPGTPTVPVGNVPDKVGQ